MNQPEVAWFNKTTHFDPPFVPIYPRRKIIITWTHMTDFTPLEERGGAGWHPNHFEAVLHINVSYHNNLVSYLPICHSHKFHEQESSIDDLPLTRKDRQPPAGPKARAPAMQQVSSICQSTSLILPSPPAARRAKLKNVSPELFSNTELATTLLLRHLGGSCTWEMSKHLLKDIFITSSTVFRVLSHSLIMTVHSVVQKLIRLKYHLL